MPSFYPKIKRNPTRPCGGLGSNQKIRSGGRVGPVEGAEKNTEFLLIQFDK